MYIWKTDGEQSALKPRVPKKSFRQRLRAATQTDSSMSAADGEGGDAAGDAHHSWAPSLPSFLDGRAKSSSYETFRPFVNSPCTVACFAPHSCQLRQRKDFKVRAGRGCWVGAMRSAAAVTSSRPSSC